MFAGIGGKKQHKSSSADAVDDDDGITRLTDETTEKRKKKVLFSLIPLSGSISAQSAQCVHTLWPVSLLFLITIFFS